MREWECCVPPDSDESHKEEKLEIVERERKKIFAYPNWEALATKLYGSQKSRRVRELKGNEYDFESVEGRGGEAESEEHKQLKAWVSKNPARIGIPKPALMEVEARLLSGDEIDVLFSRGMSFYTVEVKSRRSNEADFLRGIYQCVKYREVKRAEQAPFKVEIETILVTEGKLSPELAERAKLLGVKWKQVSIK